MAQELMFHANFRGGSLYLGCKRGILRIDSVPMVRASKFDLKSRQGSVWQECFPRLRLDRLFRVIDELGLLDNWDSWTRSTGCVQRHWASPDTWATAEACLEFLRSANLPLCRRIAALGEMHFAVLFYATRLPLLGRLLETNRGLAFALVAAAVRLCSEPQQGLDLLRNLLRKREADIAEEVGFPPGSWRLLKRVSPGALTCSRLERFRQCVWQPAKARIMRHLPRFGPSVIEILAHRPAANGGLVRIENRFLCEVAEQESATARTATIASRLFALISARNRYFLGTPLCIASMEQWKQLCDRYSPWFDMEILKMLRTMMFPPAPIQGDTCIYPITSGEELIHESGVQRNCVMTRFEGIVAGEKYFYRVDAKVGFERCTVELLREEEEDRTIWRLGEVRNSANRVAKRSTLDSLAIWLADQQHLPDSRVLPKYHPLAYDNNRCEAQYLF
ncbi:MAG: hypothetical protein WCJ35_04925 [Planctomycetota bacterium]